MCEPDVDERANRRKGDLAEIVNMTLAAHAHFENEVLRRLIGSQDGERDSHLGIERPRSCDSLATAGENLGYEVLRTRLAARPGDPDDRALQPMHPDPVCEPTKRENRIVDDDAGAVEHA